MISRITHLITHIYTLSHYPAPLKNSIVIPILKPNKPPALPSSYRPINLLPSIGKLIDKIIHEDLSDHLTLTNTIIPQQFGFRPGHSTTQQIIRIIDIIRNEYELKHTTAMLLIDLSKAFDSIDHYILTDKLTSLNLPSHLFHLIRNYIHHRTFQVRVNDTLSSKQKLLAGVPQGSSLGPALFNIYINSIPIPTDPRTQIALYADDIAILSSGRTPESIQIRLQTQLNITSDHLKSINLHINPSKSELILFNRFKKHRFQTPPDIKSDNTLIPWKPAVKYLGIKIDHRLTFGPHINTKIAQAKWQARKLCRTTKHLSPKNQFLFYNCLIRPSITYASPVWTGIRQTKWKTLTSAENAIIRKLTHKPYWISNAKIHSLCPSFKTIKLFVTSSNAKFLKSLSTHTNPLMTDLLTPRLSRAVIDALE